MVWCLRFGWHAWGTYEAAEDLDAEVFLRIYLNLGQLDHPEYFATWLTRVTRNLAADWQRQEYAATRLVPMVRLEEEEMQIADPRPVGPDDKAVERQHRDCVRKRELAPTACGDARDVTASFC